MASERFDQETKPLARGVTRRRALKLLGAVVGGGVLVLRGRRSASAGRCGAELVKQCCDAIGCRGGGEGRSNRELCRLGADSYCAA
jgi:hypothetical protein